MSSYRQKISKNWFIFLHRAFQRRRAFTVDCCSFFFLCVFCLSSYSFIFIFAVLSASTLLPSHHVRILHLLLRLRSFFSLFGCLSSSPCFRLYLRLSLSPSSSHRLPSPFRCLSPSPSLSPSSSWPLSRSPFPSPSVFVSVSLCLRLHLRLRLPLRLRSASPVPPPPFSVHLAHVDIVTFEHRFSASALRVPPAETRLTVYRRS